ncbi:MAG: GvpL/GvpF family gas vesicle protein [bacterium]
MVYLVYGILKASAAGSGPLAGVRGACVTIVTAHGLAAAISQLDAAVHAPSVDELLVYGRVVDALFRRQAVVPLRYGCFLNGPAAVEAVLEAKKDSCEALLAELDGQAEMGIRILLPAGAETVPPAAQPVDGSAYLARRKAHYQMQEADARQHQALLDRYVQALAGLNGKHRTETATRDGAVALSLDYLIPKSQVSAFREIFRGVAAQEGTRVQLSGPWPPYNFSMPSDLTAPRGRSDRRLP